MWTLAMQVISLATSGPFASQEELSLMELTLNLPTTTIVAQPFLMFC
jgi:hypothetical protein